MATCNQFDPSLVDPLFNSAALATALQIHTHTLALRVSGGEIPPPDLRTKGNTKNWRFSTIRRWNPAIADRLVDALKTAA